MGHSTFERGVESSKNFAANPLKGAAQAAFQKIDFANYAARTVNGKIRRRRVSADVKTLQSRLATTRV
jgi:hypothetical protein